MEASSPLEALLLKGVAMAPAADTTHLNDMKIKNPDLAVSLQGQRD